MSTDALSLSRDRLASAYKDFQEDPEPNFKRLAPGRKVKLRYSYVITCDEVIRGSDGDIKELRCSYDPESLGKRPPKKVAVIHWAHATQSAPVTVRMYDNLFSDARPEDFSNAFPTSRCFSNASGEEAGDFLDALSGDSCKELTSARCEPSISAMWKKHQEESEDPIFRVQFERCGFFALDRKATEATSRMVFNCTVTPRSDFAKPKGRAKQKAERPASVQVPRSSYLASTVRFEERSLAEVPVGKASTFRDASKSRGALRSCVIGASAIVLQLRRRIVRRALPYGDRKVDAAINIGRNANRLRQLKKTEQETSQPFAVYIIYIPCRLRS
eukprot:g25715.t1